MASSNNPLNEFILTPQQQSLLFAALNSNKQPSTSPANGLMTMSPSTFSGSPAQKTEANAFQESPLLDYDYDFSGDNTYDFTFADDSQSKMIGDLPGSNSSEASGKAASDTNDNEKRSHPDDDNEEGEGSAKRQETSEKAPKKPGRKPLTTEPTNKRKAQNRAAQRAFRERKEKHLKDLETKVEELEKASASANQENSQLRAQVEKMNIELAQYKKKLSVMVNNSKRSANAAPTSKHPVFGAPVISNMNDVNFQFEFPKFGQLPGPAAPPSTLGYKAPSQYSSRSPSDHLSPRDKTPGQGSNGATPASGVESQRGDDLANFSGIFSPPLTNNNVASAARGSTDSHISSAAMSSSSPSASSNSNPGASSSCGTSPEPANQSPMGYKAETLTPIGEENPLSLSNGKQDFSHFGGLDMNDMSFLNNADNFQFDPQLFGGYREPQQNILGNGLDDSFFNEAFDVDFTTPFFAPSPMPQKKDLMAQIDEEKNTDKTELIPFADGTFLTCNKIWEKLQNCPRVQNGDFDLDGLCSDLQKKAKCSGSGAVVDESTFQNVMKKYLGNDGNCSLEATGNTSTQQGSTSTT